VHGSSSEQILVLPSGPRASANLTHALSPPFRIQTAADLDELWARLEEDLPEACILDLLGLPLSSTFDSLETLRYRFPFLALIIATDFSGREMDLYRLGRLNVDGVLRMESGPSDRTIRGAVEGATATSLRRRVLEELRDDLPAAGRTALGWAIEHAESAPQVSALAAVFATGEATLARRFRRLGLGSPRSLLVWGRLIRGSQLLARRSETVESVAFRLGYSTGGALGKAMRRHVGCSPTDLVRQGGLTRALKAFRESGPRPSGQGRS
jgi:AraC-like DNA-binding protein